MNKLKSIDVIGTPLVTTNYLQLIEHCQELARHSGTSAIDFSNTHVVTMRRHDSAFRELTSQLDYFVPDGMPLIWCLNRKGAHLTDRVYGPTFMRQCFEETGPEFGHYLLGASSECLSRLQRNLAQLNPRARIVGSHHGYFSTAAEEKIVAEIDRLSPDFVWIGLGTPKQQEWIARNRNKISRGVLFAVGFAFDVNAGTKPDAPLWMQRAGLTWLFRICSEPRRLLSRYLRYNTLFLFYLLKDRFFSRNR